MSETAKRESRYQGPALFSYGLRPFFLGAALFAGLAVPAWIALWTFFDGSDAFAAARAWHVHEMLFGFLPAVMTGFLLTAIPNWTDRPPVRGPALAGLWCVWLAGRLAMAVPWCPPLLATVVDGAFFVTVAALVWREIVAGWSWSQAPIGVLITLYAGAGVFSHLPVLTGAATGAAERMALGLVMLLLTIIGGRITPNFTGEWLSQRNRSDPPSLSRFDGPSIALAGFAVLNWIVRPDASTTGWFFIAAGLAHAVRLSGWKGWTTWREPLVLILHVGYGWLAAAFLLIGGGILGAGLPSGDALHALTTGAVGVMTLAVMTRAGLGHTGRARHAGPSTVAIYLLVNVGALLRVFGPATAVSEQIVLVSAAACWSGAYLLYAVIYGPFLVRPSLDDETSA